MKYVYVLYTRSCQGGDLEYINCFSSMKKVEKFIKEKTITLPGKYCVYCWKHDLDGKCIENMFTEFF